MSLSKVLEFGAAGDDTVSDRSDLIVLFMIWIQDCWDIHGDNLGKVLKQRDVHSAVDK
jgi:hypothetical protein